MQFHSRNSQSNQLAYGKLGCLCVDFPSFSSNTKESFKHPQQTLSSQIIANKHSSGEERKKMCLLHFLFFTIPTSTLIWRFGCVVEAPRLETPHTRACTLRIPMIHLMERSRLTPSSFGYRCCASAKFLLFDLSMHISGYEFLMWNVPIRWLWVAFKKVKSINDSFGLIYSPILTKAAQQVAFVNSERYSLRV